METVDIFYQGHGIREIEHIEAASDRRCQKARRQKQMQPSLSARELISFEYGSLG
jgi:hypothetical protein